VRTGSGERTGMSFLRHGESIDPMIYRLLGASSSAHSQHSSASMSSGRLFLGRLLSSSACLCFADCQRFSESQMRRTMSFHWTAITPLTRCLSSRVQSSITSPSSLLRTHAPFLLPLLHFGLGLVRGVCAGCYQPLLLTGTSRRYSANPSSDA